jgi:hypothetical protein
MAQHGHQIFALRNLTVRQLLAKQGAWQGTWDAVPSRVGPANLREKMIDPDEWQVN